MSAAMLQLNPALPVTVLKDGVWHKALAHVLIDYSIETDLMWIVFLDSSGECWTVRNADVRGQHNLTIGRAIGPAKTMVAI